MTTFPLRFNLRPRMVSATQQNKARCVAVDADTLQQAVLKVVNHYAGRDPHVYAVQVDGVWRKIDAGQGFIDNSIAKGLVTEMWTAGDIIHHPSPIEIEQPNWAK